MTLSRTQIKKQLFWTNGCFRAAIIEFYGEFLSKEEKRYTSYQLQQLIIRNWDAKIDPAVHVIYMKKLLAMSSEKLNLILQAYQVGSQWRKQETIDAIMTELFERSADPETRSKHESKI
jgi:hypothetical protein